ncbi:MAG: c-type cytochrome domain-containing protein [Verrucomicrobiota bacterium]
MRTPKTTPLKLISIGALLVIAGMALMPLIAGKPGKPMPDWVNFLGHFHPLVLHLPIGIYTLIVAQELGAIFLKGRFRPVANFPYFFGAASAVVAVLAGFLLYQGGGEDYAGNEVAERHLWGGIVFAIFAVITFGVKIRTHPANGNRWWYRGLLFGSVGIMGIASHDGGTLTHGEGFLTKFAPSWVKVILGEPMDTAAGDSKGSRSAGDAAIAADPVVFVHVVAPILERRCVSCHKEGKSKGKLRVDSYDALMAGGADGPAVESGKSGESLIVERMELPLKIEEHMPPKGKPQPEEAELRIIKWWIDAGASSDKKLSELATPEPILADIAALSGASAAATLAVTGDEAGEDNASDGAVPVPHVHKEVDPELKAKVAELSEAFPGALTFESEGSDALAFTAVGIRANLDDAAFAKFDPVIKQFITADFTGSKITDASVAKLKDVAHLRLLRLAETDVTDAAIDNIIAIKELESLNLYGTRVTDAGVVKLATLPKLKSLYLWRTPVSPAVVEELRKKIPACEIVTGLAGVP